MQHHSLRDRVLSLEVRSKSLAYTIFESPLQLIDFGLCSSVRSGFHMERVEKIVRRFAPEVIVLRKVVSGSSRDTPAVREIIRDIRATAKRLHVPLASVEKRLIDRTFARGHRPTKYWIAVLLGACFPALAWYVPRKRKPYVPEDRRMLYFDAAATGVAYLASQGQENNVEVLLREAESRALSTVNDDPPHRFRRRR